MTLSVEIENHSGWRIDEPAAATVMRSALAAEGLGDGEVGVIFVDELRIAELNLAHRGKGDEQRRKPVPLLLKCGVEAFALF